MTTAIKYKLYPQYKPSGIDWLGDIPVGWEVKRLNYLMKNIVDKALDNKESEFIVGLENIESWTGAFISPDDQKMPEGDLKKFAKGDVLFGKLRPYLAKALLAQQDGLCVGEALIFRTPKHLLNKFLLYRILSRDFIDYIDGSTQGAKMPRAEWEFIKTLKIVFPSIEEQQKIVNYVDRETEKVDEVVAKKQKLMELLKEKRQALITHAVTKGLDPKAKMKPSGINWLGDIPERWEVKRLRFVIKTNPSKQEIKVNSPEIDVSFIPMEAVSEEGEIDLSTTKMVEEVIDGYTYFRNGDVVIAKITPCFENGKGAIMQNLINGIGFGTTEFHVLRSSDIDSKFLYLITRIYPFRSFGEVNMKGAAGQKRVPEEFIKDFSLGLPKIEEQKLIVAFLDRETGKIDEVSAKIEKQIGKLQEYRQALITCAVTGKIMVN